MSDNVVRYGTDDHTNSRGPSPSIWNDCPVGELMNNPGKGIYQFDDFKNSVVGQEEAGRSAFTGGIGFVFGSINWQAYTETALIADVALQADDDGVLMLDTDGTDDDVVGITGGDNTVGVFRSPLEGEEKRFWFEVRMKTSTVTNTDLPFFVGLMEPGKLSDGSPLGAGGALSDFDYIGFHADEADGDDLNIVYNEATSGTAQAATGAIAIEADTYFRIGIKLVILGSSIKIRFFKDGVDLGDSVAVSMSAGADTNWPGDTNMDIIIAATSGAAGANSDNLKVDWVRIAQEY